MNYFAHQIIDYAKHHIAGAAVVFIWAALLAGGFGALLLYSQTPGPELTRQTASDVDLWPLRKGKNWLLVVAIHPKCPCTRASLAELEKLMFRIGDKVDCHVLSYHPDGSLPQWGDTELVRFASSIPGVHVTSDANAQKAQAIGIAVSGGVVLFNVDGTAKFRGGITAARGHEGANLGAQTIDALARGESPEVTQTSAYGCLLAGRVDQ